MKDSGLNFSDGSCQSVLLLSILPLLPSDFNTLESNPRMYCGLPLCTGECTRAARLVRSRALRLAFGKKELEGEDEQVRHEAAEGRRGSSSFGAAVAVADCDPT